MIKTAIEGGVSTVPRLESEQPPKWLFDGDRHPSRWTYSVRLDQAVDERHESREVGECCDPLPRMVGTTLGRVQIGATAQACPADDRCYLLVLWLLTFCSRRWDGKAKPV